MKFFIFLLIFILNNKMSLANNAMDQLTSVNTSNIFKTKILSSKDYYFSQVVYKIGKKFNRKKISRKAIFEAISNFKEFVIEDNMEDKKNILNEWGGNTYSKNIISIKKSRKLKDLRKNDKYIVVYSFPKDQIFLNKSQFKIGKIINFNSKNHFQLPRQERNIFLNKINLNDINLLWQINEVKKEVNLNNVIADISPIKYQNKFEKVYNFNKIKIDHLNILPSTKFIVTNFIKNNDLSDLKKLTYMSSVCSHDNDFLNKITEFGIVSINKNILNYKSALSNYVKLCNGFMSFDKNIVKLKVDNFDEIEKMFKSGNSKLINEIHNLLEKYIDQNPLSFKAWNYLSATLRFKKKFDLALITSRVEISLALNDNNINQYNDALKSYSKARLNYDKKITNYQKQFLNNL